MNVAIIVATYGEDKWAELAHERAWPSANNEALAHSHGLASIAHYPDLTAATARNTLAAAVPPGIDWLCFLDADDELEPGYLDAMADALQTHRIVHAPVVEARSVFDAPEVLLVPKVRRVKPFVAESPRVPNRGGWPKVNECVIGTLVSRPLFEQVGGFRDHTDDGTVIGLYEDWDLWLRCWDAGAELVYTEAVYREHVNPSGRNYSSSPESIYDAIWNDHLTRTA
jgi:GT2 family glycosyltransferase